MLHTIGHDHLPLNYYLLNMYDDLAIQFHVLRPLLLEKPPIQWVQEALSLGVKRPKSKNTWSYTSTSSIYLHGMVLS